MVWNRGVSAGPRLAAVFAFFILVVGSFPVGGAHAEPLAPPQAPAGFAASVEALSGIFDGLDVAIALPEAPEAYEFGVPERPMVERERAPSRASTPQTLVPADEGTTVHPPIRITAEAGSSGFVLATIPVTGTPIYRPGSGVSAGTGTADDPYIIEGWAIDARDWPTSHIAIEIRDTSAHVLIRGNDLAANQETVIIHGADNVRFEDNRIRSGYVGLHVRDSTSLHVAENRFIATPYGVLVIASTNTTVKGNHYEESVERPITLENVHDALITGNSGEVYATAIVASSSSHLRILDNVFHLDRNFGVALHQPENAVVAGNTFTGGFGGIWAESGSAVRIEGNTLRNETGFALLLQYLDGVEVLRNEVTGARDPLHAHDLGPIVIAENRFVSNAQGLFLRDVTGAVLHDNDIEQEAGNPAIHFFLVHAPALESNRISGGLRLDTVAGATLHDNDIAGQLLALKSPDLTITANRLQGDGVMGGIFLQDSARARIAQNEVHSPGWAAIYGHGIPDSSITKNLLRHGDSAAYGVFVYEAERVEVSNNQIDAEWSIILQSTPSATITDNTLEGRSVAYDAPGSMIAGNRFEPSDSRDGTLDLFRVAGSTITDNEFTRGGILLDGPGLDDLLVTMDDSNLVDGRPIAYRAGAAAGPLPADPAQVILVDVVAASVQALSFRDVFVGVQLAFSPGASITDSTFATGTAAVYARNSDHVQVLRNTIADMDFGIFVTDGYAPRVENNSVTTAELGIVVAWSTDPHLAGNELVETQAGVAAIENTGGLIEGSIVRDSYFGVAIVGSSDNVARGNQIEGSSVGFFISESTSTTLHNNEVTSSFEGLRIQGSAGTLATHNRFETYWTTFQVWGIEDAGGHVITENDLLSFTLAAVAITPHEVDARNNWWGCSEGPTAEGCGGFIGNIQHEPWAAAPVAGAGLP